MKGRWEKEKGMAGHKRGKNETRAVLRLVWPFDGIVQKHIQYCQKVSGTIFSSS